MCWEDQITNYLGLNIKRKGRNPAEYQLSFLLPDEICSTRCFMLLLLGLHPCLLTTGALYQVLHAPLAGPSHTCSCFLGQETVIEGYWGLICIHFDLSDVSLPGFGYQKKEKDYFLHHSHSWCLMADSISV